MSDAPAKKAAAKKAPAAADVQPAEDPNAWTYGTDAASDESADTNPASDQEN